MILPRIAIAALLLVLAVAGTAHADSIAYVKAGDVWLSTSDGARQYRVTASGGYSDVTQADDGTLVALHGVRLHRLDRAGNVVADFDTPVSDTRPEGQRTFYGPFDPALSPSGRRLSYTYYFVSKGSTPGCFPPTCMTTVTEGGTGYSYADRQTHWDEPGLGRHSGWRNATWLDDATTMISDPTHVPNADVLLDTVGDTGVPIMDWFSDNGTQHLGAGEMTRARTKLAFQAGQGDTAIRLYRMPAAYPALPEACYEYSGAGMGAPTWSSDGARLAWADASGVKTVRVPDFAAGCTTNGATPDATLLIAGATQPDWGPADVPAGAGRTPNVPAPPAPSPSPAPSPAPAPPAERLMLGVTRASLSKGIALRVTTPRAGRLTATVKLRGRTLATGNATVRRAGTQKLTLRLNAAGRKSLRKVRSARVTVRITLGTLTTSKTVTVKGGKR